MEQGLDICITCLKRGGLVLCHWRGRHVSADYHQPHQEEESMPALSRKKGRSGSPHKQPVPAAAAKTKSSWGALLSTLEVTFWCPICSEQGHFPLNCHLTEEECLRALPRLECPASLSPAPVRGAKASVAQEGGGRGSRAQEGEVRVSSAQEREAPVSSDQGRAAPVSSDRWRVAPVSSDRWRVAPVSSDRWRVAPVSSNQGRAAPVSSNQGRAVPVSICGRAESCL
ncbi:UNVERIFIED_CONTAM: hypothetical protein FKN15_047467 [Acipenser sinensis]